MSVTDNHLFAEPIDAGRPTSRRAFLRRGGALAAAGLLASLVGCRANQPVSATSAAGPEIGDPPDLIPPEQLFGLDRLPQSLPVPDLSESNIIRTVAGIRPYRRGSYRLECETFGHKNIAHNYGHGGAGVTLSWGTAELCVEQLQAEFGAQLDKQKRIAVLGGGIVGLSTARVLQEQGYRVAIYAEHFGTETTSNLAGAQFAPSGVTTRDPAQLNEMIRRSTLRFSALADRGLGVARKINYTTARGGGALRRLPADLLPSRTLDRLPFEDLQQPGRAHATFLIEPPRYLPWLMEQFKRSGGQTVTKRFSDALELFRLPETTIVNCLGLGAGDVFRDDALIPTRGQLVHLKPQALPYMISNGGYIFPRADALVLGGTYERNQTVAVTDSATCQRIMQRHRQFFNVEA